MNRRQMIAALGGATAWPLAARGQQAAMPVIGFLSSASPQPPFTGFVAALRHGLNDGGYVEGRNLTIEYRWADNQYGRLPELAADLVRQRVAVIVASGANPPIAAAKAATSTIPIVFTGADDPVRHGLVASFNRPGGNVTGMTLFTAELEAKRLELLRELVPGVTKIAVLLDPNNPNFDAQVPEVSKAGSALGVQVIILKAGTPPDIDAAFGKVMRIGAGALSIGAGAYFQTRREQIVALAAHHALPVIYPFRDPVLVGGLISYGNNISDSYRQGGLYVARILKGEKPADLPVIQPTKFELVVNLKTAKALGLTIGHDFLLRADDLVE
jgi:putative tryptophan/tyrosine transport system substrate-binding protein